MTESEKYQDYLKQLRTEYVKVCRARFLNPDGSTAFAITDNPNVWRNRGMFQDQGTLSCNMQNGTRRTLALGFANISEEFTYNVNNVWFGTEIAWDEGLVLSDGTPFYIQQGVFVVANPEEVIASGQNEITHNLTDKWANLDGTLFGNLEAEYAADAGVNIFAPIAALLTEGRGNGRPVDNKTPIFTEYYNGKTQTLPDGTSVSLTDAPYTLRVEPGTLADVVLGFASMLNAWVGYDPTGALRIDPSQDNVIDANKPVLWEFSEDEAELVGLTYSVKNTAVHNDIIVVGQQSSDYAQPAARAQNLDLASDTNVQTIGRKTLRINSSNFGTQKMCEDYALWELKRATVLQKAVTIQCKQIFHIQPNQLVTIVRTDKPGKPVERHLVMGFSRGIRQDDGMTINCVSVNDFPTATLTAWNS